MYLLGAVFDALHHFRPFRKVAAGGINAELSANDLGKVCLLQHQRRLIKAGQRDIFDDAVGLYIAEHGDFFENGFLQRLVAAQNDEIGVDAHALQLLDGMLCRL